MGARGSLSHARFATRFAQGVPRLPTLRKALRNNLLPLLAQVFLGQRARIAPGHDPPTNLSQLEPSRHRRVATFLGNLVAGLIASTDQPKDPSLHLRMSPAESWPTIAL